jgi:hypothetical protein
MADSRTVRIWDLVAVHSARQGAPPSIADVCAVAVAALAVSGAGLTAVSRAGTAHVMCVTDDVSEQLAELQLIVGEGPRSDAAGFGGPVLAADLSAGHIARRWPAFASMAVQAGAAAVFAFPLQIGAIRAGILELYRIRPGPLTLRQLGDALVLADTATVLMLDGQHSDGLDHDGVGYKGPAPDGVGPDGHARDGRDQPAGQAGPSTSAGGPAAELARRRAEIDQATGMLTEQLGVGIEEAFVRLRAYAYARERRLIEVAGDIVARRLRLGPGRDLRGGEQ